MSKVDSTDSLINDNNVLVGNLTEDSKDTDCHINDPIKDLDEDNINNSDEFQSMDEVISAIIDNKEKCQLYLDMLIENLEYLQYHKLVEECFKIYEDVDRSQIIKLQKLIFEETKHILPFKLTQSLLLYITDASHKMSNEQLLQKLKKSGPCYAVQNVITPESDVLNPNNFKGKLYPPQAAILKRMFDIESVEYYNVGDKKYKWEVGVVSERLGFGKTYLCSALLSHNHKMDVKKYETARSKITSENIKTIFDCENTVASDKTCKSNIVICNLKTLKEWEYNIKTLTDLSVVKITSGKMLEQFEKMFSEGNLPKVILVKDGKIAGKVLIERMTELFENNVFNRIIIDDYDVLNMDKSISLPYANFYWLVSSTRNFGNRKSTTYKKTTKLNNGLTIEKIENCMSACDNYTNIKCIDSFLSKEYNMPIIEVYKSNPLESRYTLCKKCQKINDEANELLSKLCEGYDCRCEECVSIIDKLDYLEINSYYCSKCKANTISQNSEKICELIEDFILNGPSQFKKKKQPRYFKKLIQGSIDVPFDNSYPIKALFLAESNNEEWYFKNIKATGITNKNIREFEKSEHQLGICSTLSGVNLGYLTHIIVTDISDKSDIVQFIGRAQRLNRKNNLQVLYLSHKCQFYF